MSNENTQKTLVDAINVRFKNRFLVEFPEVCGIYPEWVSKVKRPSYLFNVDGAVSNLLTVNVRWNFNKHKEGEPWYYEMTHHDVIRLLHELNAKLEETDEGIILKELDGAGTIARATVFTKPKFTSFEYSEYDYKKNEPVELILRIHYNDCYEFDNNNECGN